MPPASTRGSGGGSGPVIVATPAATAATATTTSTNSSSSNNNSNAAASTMASPPRTPAPPAGSAGTVAAAAAASGGAGGGAGSTSASATALERAGLKTASISSELHRVAPAFSPSGDTVACAKGSAVLLLAAGTGELVARIQAHARPISALAFGPGRYLLTAGLDGHLRSWEYQKEQRRVHDHAFGREIVGMAPSPTDRNIVYLTLGRKLGQEGEATSAAGGEESSRYKVVEYQIKEGKTATIMPKVSPRPFFLQPTSDGQFLVVASASRLCVWSLAEKALCSEVLFDDKHPRDGSLLQAVALNPAKREVATGDVNGRVYLWPTVFEKLGAKLDPRAAKKPTLQAKLKQQLKRRLFRSELRRWHAHGVDALAFSPDGLYLLSGGQEAVLAVTQLAGRGKDSMTYLPRLGARITTLGLSPDGLACALTTRANALKLVRPLDLKVSWEHKSLAHLAAALPSAAPEEEDGGIAGDPHGLAAGVRLWAAPHAPGQLVSNCLPGKVQLLDVASEAVQAEVEAVPTNVVSRSGDERLGAVPPPWVTHSAVSGDGRRLVTVERRVGEEGVRRTSLKFWERQHGGGQHFALSAVVDSPHEGQGQGALLALAYHPTRDLVATAAAGGAFSLWACLADDGEDAMDAPGAGRARWVCQATVPFQRGACRSLAFSADGTLLAVGCGRAVALWDPLNVRLLTVLADPREAELSPGARDKDTGVDDLDILSVAFLPRCPRLVCATRRALVVWDLLSLSPVQRYEAGRVAHLCAAAGPAATAGSGQGFTIQGEAVHFAAVLTGAEEERALQLRQKEAKAKAKEQQKQKGHKGRQHQHHHQQAQPSQTIVAFNAFRAAPLLTYPLPKASPPLLALAMTEGPAATGLCYMTRDGVTLVGEPSACQPHYRRSPALPGGGAGSRKRGAVAAVELSGSSSKSKRPRVGAAAAAAAERPGKAASIAELLGTTTGHLPPPSAVFDSFLAGLLPASLPPPPPPADALHPLVIPSIPAAAAASTKANAPAVAAVPAGAVPGPTALPSTGVRKDLLQLLTDQFRRNGAAVAVTSVTEPASAAKPGKKEKEKEKEGGKTPSKKAKHRAKEEEQAQEADGEEGAAPTENGVGESTPKSASRAASRRRSGSISTGSARKQRKS